MRPLSVPAVSSITALMSVGLPDATAPTRPLRRSSGVVATTPAELQRALAEAVASGRPTLINAVIDETAGTESGRITSLNPQKAAIHK